MHRAVAAGLLLLLPAAVARGDASPGAGERAETPAPWIGMHRAEVVAMLGEPARAKRAGDDETLTYRLVRLAEGAAPGPEQRVVDVPGVGPCATAPVGRQAGVDEPVIETEPTAVDDSGRLVGGGTTTSHSRSAVWKDGKWVGDDVPPESLPRGRKVKLTLRLGPDGVVREWEVSPKVR